MSDQDNRMSAIFRPSGNSHPTDEESNFVQLLRLRCKDSKDLTKWMETKTDR